jgi:hypothetical protein
MNETIIEILNEQTTVSGISYIANRIKNSPQVIRDSICEKEKDSFDEANSVCIYDKKGEIYGYILTEQKNIPNVKLMFDDKRIINYLSNTCGLFIKKVVLNYSLDNSALVYLLNTLHYAYCDGDFTDDTKYIWMNNEEIVFVPTKQDEAFSERLNNNVSKAFYNFLYQTTLKPNTIL